MEFEPIEGETPVDLSHLKLSGVTTRQQLSEVEFANILKPVVKYLAGKPSNSLARFDFDWCLKLHKEMFCDVWTWAGEIRTEDLNFGVPWPQVGQQLAQMCDDLKFRRDVWPASETAVHLHYEAVAIHPFHNGNGRWARLLTNVFLLQTGHPVVDWPDELDGTSSLIRSEYLEAVKAADDHNFEALQELHGRFTDVQE